jgi:hypothetical protein
MLYFSHSYREPDAPVVKYFYRLIRSEGLTANLDPPSQSVNAAKLERQLRVAGGMIAVLTWREDGASEHILFEISLCLKARKPLLVFIEDNLPDAVISPRLLQRRFSRHSLLQQTREHRHALGIMKSYLADNPPPAYQPSVAQRSCLLVGNSQLPASARKGTTATVRSLGYSPVELGEPEISPIYDGSTYEAIASADLAVCLLDARSPNTQYLIGAIHSASLPTITLTARADQQYQPRVPKDYHPLVIATNDVESLCQTVRKQIAIFEEDFVELDDRAIEKYFDDLLPQAASQIGQYTPETRDRIVQNVFMAYQVGAMGPGAHAERMTFSQIWNQVGSEIQLEALATELSQLRSRLKEEATEPEHDIAVGSVALAESAAKEGNGPKTLEHLAGATRWALDVASNIGARVAAAAIRSSLGMP